MTYKASLRVSRVVRSRVAPNAPRAGTRDATESCDFAIRPPRRATRETPGARTVASFLALSVVCGLTVALAQAAPQVVDYPDHARIAQTNLVVERGTPDCGSLTLTQSTNPDVIGNTSVVCLDGAVSAETSAARAFLAPSSITLKCVTFGVRINQGADWPVQVRILSGDVLGAYDSLALLSEASVVVPGDANRDFFTVDLSDVAIPAGANFVVELRTPSRRPPDAGDGGQLALSFNQQGQSAPTYFRGPLCGSEDFVDLGTLGFPNLHLVMSVGYEEGGEAILLDGFPRHPVGGATLDESNGEIVVSGDPMAGPFGMVIDYGDTSSGVKTPTFQWDSAQGNALSFEYHATNGDVDAITFTGAPDGSLVLETSIKNTADSFFDVFVYELDVLVGVFRDQTSGSVTISSPERILWGFFGYCHNRTIIADGITIKERYYGFGANANASFSAGGPAIVGDSFEIVPNDIKGVSPPPPESVAIMATGMASFTQFSSADGATPAIRFGDAMTEPRSIEGDPAAAVGVETSVLATSGPIGLSGVDADFDGAADVSISNLGSTGNDGVRLLVGGVDSATIDMTVINPAMTGACISLSAFQQFGGLGGTVALDPCVGCPPPFKGEWVNLVGNFSDVGSGTFTLQIVHNGAIVHEQSGMSGLVGASVGWPIKGGKLGGATPCWRMCYPQDTLFLIAGTAQQVMMDEIRLLAENAPPLELLDYIEVRAANMDELRLSNPETILPPPPEPCVGDTNGDNIVNFSDLNAVLAQFGQTSPFLPGDVNHDGVVDFGDLNTILSNFGFMCP